MTGCYYPCHACIDSGIHTFAGIQLRNYCNEIMEAQGHEEPTGEFHFPNEEAAKIAVQTVRDYKEKSKNDGTIKGYENSNRTDTILSCLW